MAYLKVEIDFTMLDIILWINTIFWWVIALSFISAQIADGEVKTPRPHYFAMFMASVNSIPHWL